MTNIILKIRKISSFAHWRYSIQYHNSTCELNEKASKWLEEQAFDAVHSGFGCFYFANDIDAMLFKMKWGKTSNTNQ